MDKKKRILIIPRHQVFVKFIDVPSVEKPEIESMAEFQVLKEIPHPKEDIVIGLRNMGSYREGFSSLMLSVVNKDAIQERLKEREASGIQTESIWLFTELLYLFLLKKGFVKEDRVSFVVHVDPEYSEIMIINKARLMFSRAFKNNEKFLEEIDRSVLSYERDREKPAIDEVVIISPSEVDIKDALPQIKGHFTASLAFHEYSEDLGDLDLGAEIDLLPREISHERKKTRRKQENIVTYFLVGLIMMLSFAMLFFKLHEKGRILGMLSARLSEAESKTVMLGDYLEKASAVRNHLECGRFIIEALDRSRLAVPGGVLISGLDYDGSGSIFYKGTAENTSPVFTFVKKLEGLECFSKVEIKHATKKKTKGIELTDFSIRCHLKL